MSSESGRIREVWVFLRPIFCDKTAESVTLIFIGTKCAEVLKLRSGEVKLIFLFPCSLINLFPYLVLGTWYFFPWPESRIFFLTNDVHYLVMQGSRIPIRDL
jgi:hypothetical protein